MRIGNGSNEPAGRDNVGDARRRATSAPIPTASADTPAGPLGPLMAGGAALPQRRHTSRDDPSLRTPFDRYVVDSLLHEQAFNGSRNEERLGQLFMPSQLTGMSPYWDLDQRAIERSGGTLALFGQADVPAFRGNAGGTRVRLHYAEREDRLRMITAFGPPHGQERAYMRSSYRTLQIQADAGWHQVKFSMPEGLFGGPAIKMLSGRDIEAAVCASHVLAGYREYIAEPAGLVLDMGDGKRPIAQLLRATPTAGRGFRSGDMAVVLHVLTDPEFATTAPGQRLFDRYDAGRGDPQLAQQQFLHAQIAPRLAQVVWLALSETHAHPAMHEQNVDVIVDRHGAVVDLMVKDLHDLALDARGIEAAGHLERWSGLDDRAGAWNRPLADHYRAYLGQVGRGTGTSEPTLLHETGRQLLAIARQHLRADWLESQHDSPAYQASFGTHGTGDIGACVAGVRELLNRAREAGQMVRLPFD